jgi:hypothetical protein
MSPAQSEENMGRIVVIFLGALLTSLPSGLSRITDSDQPIPTVVPSVGQSRLRDMPRCSKPSSIQPDGGSASEARP